MAKFKVGDRVNLVGVTENPGNIMGVCGSQCDVLWDSLKESNDICEGYHLDELYLVEPAKPSAYKVIQRRSDGALETYGTHCNSKDKAEEYAKHSASLNPGLGYAVFELVSEFKAEVTVKQV